MSAPQPQLTRRELYRRERQLKQNSIFSIVFSVMAGVSVLSLLVLTGILPIPFLNGFSAKVEYASAGDIPCPSEETQPLAASGIKVQVLNTTSRSGVARDASDMLKTVGFQVADPSNSSPEYAASAQIQAGPQSVDQAYTVARFFPSSRVTLTDNTEPGVTVLLGSLYNGALTAEDLQRVQENHDNLKGPSTCLLVKSTK